MNFNTFLENREIWENNKDDKVAPLKIANINNPFILPSIRNIIAKNKPTMNKPPAKYTRNPIMYFKSAVRK